VIDEWEGSYSVGTRLYREEDKEGGHGESICTGFRGRAITSWAAVGNFRKGEKPIHFGSRKEKEEEEKGG